MLANAPRLSLLGVLAMGIAIAGYAAYYAGTTYDTATSDSEAEALSRAAVLQSRIEGLIRHADGTLRQLQRSVPLEALNAPASARAAAYWNEEFDRRLVDFPELGGLRIFGADGGLLFTNDARNVGRVNIGDRPHFRQTCASSYSDPLVISSVLIARTTGTRLVVLARPYKGEDGKCLGIVTTSLDLAQLNALIRASGPQEQFVGVYRSDTHERIASSAPSDSVDRYLDAFWRSDSPRLERQGHVRFALENGDRYTLAMSSLERFPLLVLVGRSEKEALAGWKRQTGISLAILGSILLLMTFVFVAWVRTHNRLAHAQSVLEERVRNRTHELQDAAEKLKQGNVELNRFAHVAAHDLQTPLRAIAGFAELLEEDLGPALAPRQRNWLDRVVGSARFMQGMLDELLEYARVDSRGQPFTAVDLNETCAAVVGMLQLRLEEATCTVSIAHLPTIPGDRIQVAELFQNLLENAIKYKSDAPLRVEVSCEFRAGEHIVSVDDNGRGIREENLERAFEIFFRETPNQAGSGLGLAICRRIVVRHRGRIWAERSPLGGTAVKIAFPEGKP